MSHYDWLNENLESFCVQLGINQYSPGIIVAHGDKCYSYEGIWAKAGIPFHHGVAIYLISNYSPFNKEVRDTVNGWVKPDKWVIDNYNRFKPYLNP